MQQFMDVLARRERVERHGKGYDLVVGFGHQNNKKRITLDFDELVGDEFVSDDDMADILAKAAQMIVRKKINARSALHPGARKRCLTI